MLLFYIRHGDPVYNPDSLTPLGHRQAEAVAKRLALFGVDRIYSSTSNRAIQTAEPLCELTKKELVQLDFAKESYTWSEFAVEDYSGKKYWAQYTEKYAPIFVSEEVRSLGYDWYEYPAFRDCKFKEGMLRVDEATDNFFAELGYEHDRSKHMYNIVNPSEERIALFAHAGFGTVFLSSLLDIPYPEYSIHYDMCHSGMTVVWFPNDKSGMSIPRVLVSSDDGHLYKEGLPTFYNGENRF